MREKNEKNIIKKISAIVLTLGVVTSQLVTSAYAASNTDQILALMPGVTAEELNQSIKEVAFSSKISEQEAANQILNELTKQDQLSKEEIKNQRSRASYTLGPATYNGDIFYEPASFASYTYGHVGIYWTSDIIVESVPNDGVRKMNRKYKSVQSGSKIMTIRNYPASMQNTVSNWAYARIGESYSYNFATNRSTGYYGAKNCSKLVWSAYRVKGDIDLDCNGGAGVYPKDILNSSKVRVYKTY